VMRARSTEAMASGAVNAKAAEDMIDRWIKVLPTHIVVVNNTRFLD
jgi:hypothetical protein